MSTPFKTPRPLSDITNAQIISGSTSSTEEMDSDREQIEELVREQTSLWLATHGPKLFALEASKFNAQEKRRINVRSQR